MVGEHCGPEGRRNSRVASAAIACEKGSPLDVDSPVRSLKVGRDG